TYMKNRKPKTVYLGLGSNLGSKKHNIKKALTSVARLPATTVKKVSGLYHTKPMYYEDQPNFVNAVARVRTGLAPEELFVGIKKIEKDLGRKVRDRWGPRIIDIDILLYDKKVIRTTGLTIPHRRMHERPFVLQPLLEIAPRASHPVKHRLFKKILEELEPVYKQ
ncbi:MAG: 2-amino-4-hydroxy-6-hydroxymethyldihydropteridine diphosphokinase, partial [Elusimicrobia bacterium]|nr:2-amino-4-hydroxy-6-hydroxymethyldihydropteridine diphosphokinase [Elusimicrobiota bacterium]